MSKVNKAYLTLLLSLVAVGCKHPLDIVGQGDILSTSGNRDCYYEWANDPNDPMHSSCADNGTELGQGYIETYTAMPRDGWYFHRWANWCTHNDPYDPVCSWDIPASVTDQALGATLRPQVAIFRPEVVTGYKSLYMGHSLFYPLAEGMEFHAAEAGFVDHDSNHNYFFPAWQGAPISIWEDPDRQAQIKAVLDEGGFDIVGMAIHHDPSTQDLEGYRLWVDYALKENPGARFFIGVPWLWNPILYVDAESYDQAWHDYHPPLAHGLIDQLREEFPYTDFFCIPYGQASGELYKMWKSPEGLNGDITSPLESETDSEAIWTDLRPHADEILVDLGQLIWLKAIYGVDLNNYAYDPGYNTDLKAIAQEIIDSHDQAYNAPYLDAPAPE